MQTPTRRSACRTEHRHKRRETGTHGSCLDLHWVVLPENSARKAIDTYFSVCACVCKSNGPGGVQTFLSPSTFTTFTFNKPTTIRHAKALPHTVVRGIGDFHTKDTHVPYTIHEVHELLIKSEVLHSDQKHCSGCEGDPRQRLHRFAQMLLANVLRCVSRRNPRLRTGHRA